MTPIYHTIPSTDITKHHKHDQFTHLLNHTNKNIHHNGHGNTTNNRHQPFSHEHPKSTSTTSNPTYKKECPKKNGGGSWCPERDLNACHKRDQETKYYCHPMLSNNGLMHCFTHRMGRAFESDEITTIRPGLFALLCCFSICWGLVWTKLYVTVSEFFRKCL